MSESPELSAARQAYIRAFLSAKEANRVADVASRAQHAACVRYCAALAAACRDDEARRCVQCRALFCIACYREYDPSAAGARHYVACQVRADLDAYYRDWGGGE